MLLTYLTYQLITSMLTLMKTRNTMTRDLPSLPRYSLLKMRNLERILKFLSNPGLCHKREDLDFTIRPVQRGTAPASSIRQTSDITQAVFNVFKYLNHLFSHVLNSYIGQCIPNILSVQNIQSRQLVHLLSLIWPLKVISDIERS